MSLAQTAARLIVIAFLVEIAVSAAMAAPAVSPLQPIIDEAVKQFPGRAAVTFIELKSGQRASARGEMVFEAASLVKLGVLVELMEQVKGGRIKLADTLVLRDADKTSGSGKLKDMPAGTRVSVHQAAEWMITISDNTATDMLVARLGMARVEHRLQSLGLHHTHLRRKMMDFAAIDRGLDNVTSADDMAALLALIATHRVVDAASCEQMIGILERQQRRHIIAAGLPKGTRVASKTGELNGIIHDVAIVYTPKGNYVLALLGSQVKNPEAAREAFRRLSTRIYRKVMETSR